MECNESSKSIIFKIVQSFRLNYRYSFEGVALRNQKKGNKPSGDWGISIGGPGREILYLAFGFHKTNGRGFDYRWVKTTNTILKPNTPSHSKSLRLDSGQHISCPFPLPLHNNLPKTANASQPLTLKHTKRPILLISTAPTPRPP